MATLLFGLFGDVPLEVSDVKKASQIDELFFFVRPASQRKRTRSQAAKDSVGTGRWLRGDKIGVEAAEVLRGLACDLLADGRTLKEADAALQYERSSLRKGTHTLSTLESTQQ